MDVILFGLKRAFQASLRFTRPKIAAYGLTAARFDMLHVIQKSSGAIVTQRDLRRVLGVTAPTVSRMLGSLEKLGLVTRATPRGGDRRRRIVFLTVAGRASIERAFKALVRRRVFRRAFNFVLTYGHPRDRGKCFLATADAESLFAAVRNGFGDTASLVYPWGHPDD
jgi:DNA-binding MarR family transcriptional regulator